MGKNKKLIFVGIIITLIIIALSAIWRFSINLVNAKGTTESQLSQATRETNAKSNDSTDTVSVQDTGITSQTVDTSNWDLTKVDIVYDTENIAVPVPKGYVASGADGEHTVNTGFVIYEGTGEVTNDNAWDESCTRNQWVWIPVPNTSRVYKTDSNGKKEGILYSYTSTDRNVENNWFEPRYLVQEDEDEFSRCSRLQGMSRKEFLNEMQQEFDSTMNSIEKYGGFWLGRYEIGNVSSNIPVVQRMNDELDQQDWYVIYSNVQRISANKNVKVNLLYGCLWDETLQWLVDSGNKTYEEIDNSSSWGNYYDATFQYQSKTEGILTKELKTSTMIPSGSSEYCKANNVYDLAGNAEEWLLESTTNGGMRSLRGGDRLDYGSARSVEYRNGSFPGGEYLGYGFRAYMYI